MRPALKTVPTAGILLLGGLAGLALIARADTGGETLRAKAASGGIVANDAPVYQIDSQSTGAVPSTTSPTLLAQAPASPPRTSGTSTPSRPRGSARPGSAASRGRDWSIGRRMTLHKPWMRPAK